MKQILCVLLSNWSIDRVNRKRSESAHKAHGWLSVGLDPLVIVRTVANRQEITAVSTEAREFGIRIGMTLAQARALCARVTYVEHEPHRDLAALEALSRWMIRFTPVVSLGTTDEKVNSVHPSSFCLQPSLFLDLTGCERVFGGIRNILTQVSHALKRFRIHARLAVAPTPGAAWAVAFASREAMSIVDPAALQKTLHSLPPVSLRIPLEIAHALNHLGIDTIAQLIKLPRNALPARFGGELLRRLDQALGNIPEPLTPLEPFAPIQARMDFEGPVENLDAIWIVFKQLLTRIVTDLLRRGHGARELQIEFYRPYAVTLYKTISLSRPSRDLKNLFNLLRCALEMLETDVGFLGIKLIVSRSQRICEEQIQLLEHEEFIAETELTQLIERLRIRLGNEVIAQPVLVESHVPERSWHGLLAHERSAARAKSPCHRESVRPLHLLNTPLEIGVMVSPSHDQEGRPVSFSWKSQVHPLPHATGPERIAGQWWRSHDKTRDYFDVEDREGRRFWIFRVRETGRWYVHGEFE